ncbi:MAG TPA: hypothetical protein H9663_02720 [Firmicutes bacterium]|nr:hypothetical protein [Bacillota bacterium]
MNRRGTFNICLTVVITAAFILLGAFVFGDSYLRFGETAKDFGLSVGYYFCTLFGLDHDIVPSVTEYSSVMDWDILLPSDFESFTSQATSFFSLLVDGENFAGYWAKVGDVMLVLLKVVAIILPCLLILGLVIWRLYKSGNTKHNRDTVPLRVFKMLSRWFYQPLKRAVLSYRDFLTEHRAVWILWAVMWAFHLNAASIVTGFLAYYFYFVLSFDVANLYVQVCKLFIDLQVIFRYFPWWCIAFVCWLLFDHWRKSVALNRLRHFEARNCGFINELPIVSMACGSMGKKKTTLITDMVLSQEVMFRQKALEILQQNDMKFPYFPWIAFEDELRRCMEHGTVYNLASVKAWVALKRSRFIRHRNAQTQFYGYDYARYGTTFDDSLKISRLFAVLETYAQAYFIYVLESSLIVANYSVRTDNMMADNGNFPMWLTDFFPKRRRPQSRHAHILDFDVLRLGRKVLENNPNAGSFEFGVVGITEIGKERGNNLELREIKKGADDTNQKNDLFNSWLKMCRHSATVDNFPFIKVFTDEQRPESWGADARDLADIINIASCGDMRLALPFYTIEEMLSEWAFNRFISLYYDFRFRRGDNTLLVHILKSVVAWLWRRNLRIFNRFGYSVLKIEKERGTMDGKTENKKYYLMSAKIYAQRFSTDCFSDYFNDMARRSYTGLADYLEYATEKASVEELKMQNSYFINSLYRDADGDSSA